MDAAYRITAYSTAEVDCAESTLFESGDPEKTRRIGCIAYLLEGKDRRILIDTGIRSLSAVNSTVRGKHPWQASEGSLRQQLIAQNIDPNSITDIILTHAHYDHAGAVMDFPNSRVWINELERSLMSDESTAQGRALSSTARWLNQHRKTVWIKHSCSDIPGVVIQHVGGHTPGSQIVSVRTQLGACILTGDAVFLEENVRKSHAIGFAHDPAAARQTVRLLAQEDALLLTGHDLSALGHMKKGTARNV